MPLSECNGLLVFGCREPWCLAPNSRCGTVRLCPERRQHLQGCRKCSRRTNCHLDEVQEKPVGLQRSINCRGPKEPKRPTSKIIRFRPDWERSEAVSDGVDAVWSSPLSNATVLMYCQRFCYYRPLPAIHLRMFRCLHCHLLLNCFRLRPSRRMSPVPQCSVHLNKMTAIIIIKWTIRLHIKSI